jgi:hypothetical protein
VPWGPVELEVALRIGAERNAVAAWKPVIDSLVAILGRAPGKTEFDIEDGRIVALAIHQEIDRSLGHAVQAQLWWRAAGPGASAGPALAYEVGSADEGPAVPASGPRGASARTAPPADDFEVIATLARLRELQASAAGYVIITDTASPPRMHRAGCAAIREENFVGKVIERGMRNGRYLHALDSDSARRRWPRLTKHGCVAR